MPPPHASPGVHPDRDLHRHRHIRLMAFLHLLPPLRPQRRRDGAENRLPRQEGLPQEGASKVKINVTQFTYLSLSHDRDMIFRNLPLDEELRRR